MAKCGVCGKFLSHANRLRCCQCRASYRKECANVSDSALGSNTTWVCLSCRNKSPNQDNFATPVKAHDCNHNASSISVSPNVIDVQTQDQCVLADEIRLIRSEISALRTEIKEYRAEINHFKAALELQGVTISNMEKRIIAVEQRVEKNIHTDNTIMELKCQLNDRDQELLLNDVEIAGIPESKEESVFHLVKMVTILLGVDIEERDVVHAERVGSTRRNRTEAVSNNSSSSSDDASAQTARCIFVRFARRVTRDQVLRAARVRRGLTSADLEIRGKSSRVYINERLTPTNRRLFYQARQAGSSHNWKYIWTKEGRILARKADGHKVERIRCFKDIEETF